MIQVGLFIKDSYTDEFHRVELFTDEKISVNSSIQNINDISKTYTDFSRTFSVPASVKNNQIFRHWYDASNTNSFSTRVKVESFIELDTIPFRTGKVQLEGCNLKNGRPQSYSLTFIGNLGSLKDKFNGLFLKDLDTSAFNFNNTPAKIIQKVTTLTPTSPATPNIAFPLISSSRLWNYGQGGDDDISQNNHPIRYNELFPALRLQSVLKCIETTFGINFNITSGLSTFLNDEKFYNAFLYLKNSDVFFPLYTNFPIISSSVTYGVHTTSTWNVSTNTLNYVNPEPVTGFPNMTIWLSFFAKCSSTYVGKRYWINTYLNGVYFSTQSDLITLGGGVGNIFAIPFGGLLLPNASSYANGAYTFTFSCEEQIPFNTCSFNFSSTYGSFPSYTWENTNIAVPNFTCMSLLNISSIMPNIKIEDFFSGLLKMFNLTCYSDDGINYIIDTLDNYYSNVVDVDLTKHILQDNRDLSRVQTYKKINFKYQESESLINVAFKSINGIGYGDLYYSDSSDGQEYNIELPFENLNFENLYSTLQVGFCIKTDYKQYIPKPIILYDYNPNSITATSAVYHLSSALTGTGTSYNNYRAFGQEFNNGTDVFTLNYNQQQSTLNNIVYSNGLYLKYYNNYFNNIFNYKARLYKCKAILPTSILTTLKLNNNVIIRDEKYLINNMVTDLTTGEVQFELLTDIRQ